MLILRIVIVAIILLLPNSTGCVLLIQFATFDVWKKGLQGMYEFLNFYVPASNQA